MVGKRRNLFFSLNFNKFLLFFFLFNFSLKFSFDFRSPRHVCCSKCAKEKSLTLYFENKMFWSWSFLIWIALKSIYYSSRGFSYLLFLELDFKKFILFDNRFYIIFLFFFFYENLQFLFIAENFKSLNIIKVKRYSPFSEINYSWRSNEKTRNFDKNKNK